MSSPGASGWTKPLTSGPRLGLHYHGAVNRKFVLGLAALLVSSSWTGCRKWNEPPRREAVSGTIEVDETRVASRYGGRVEEILAREGDLLKPGQVLFRLQAPELRARHAQASALLEELITALRPCCDGKLFLSADAGDLAVAVCAELRNADARHRASPAA